MHIIGLILTIIIGISVWWWRLRMLKRAGDTVIDAAERFRGRQKRRRIAEQTGFSPVTAISEPVTAAATLIRMIVGEDVWPMVRGRMKAAFADLSSEAHADEALTYAEWAGNQGLDDGRATRMLIDMLRDRLTFDERQQLVAILEDAAASGDQDVQAAASRHAIALVN